MENAHITQFAEALRAAGLVLKGDPVFDDRIHRVDVEGKPGGRDGSYRAKVEGDRAFGWFQNWTIHTESIPWHANGSERLTREQRQHLADERAAHDAARAKAMQEQQERAAAECHDLWNAARPVDTHPYLTSKGVPSHGLRQGIAGQQITVWKDDGEPRVISLKGKLFVPMRDVHGKLWSLQYINDDGRKMYHPGGKKEGCHFVIAGEGEGACFVEGYCTGASVHDLSGGRSVIVAFDAGNLLTVATAYIGPHVFAADNDHAREQETGPDGKPKINAGRAAAIAAAEAVGGIAIFPEFAEDEADLSDWNDLVEARGIDEARTQFRRQLALEHRRNNPIYLGR